MLLNFLVDSCLQYLSKLCVGVVEITLVITNFTPYHSQGVLRPLFPGSLPTRRNNTSTGGAVSLLKLTILIGLSLSCPKTFAASAMRRWAKMSWIGSILVPWWFAAMCKFVLLKTSSFVFARLMSAVVMPRIFCKPFNWKDSNREKKPTGIAIASKAWRSFDWMTAFQIGILFLVLHCVSFKKKYPNPFKSP